jgi:hypothetical protein
VVATFHRISEGSLPVSGSMLGFGISVYPSWTRDARRAPTWSFLKAGALF